MDTAGINQARQQEIAKSYAHTSSEKRKREIGQVDKLSE